MNFANDLFTIQSLKFKCENPNINLSGNMLQNAESELNQFRLAQERNEISNCVVNSCEDYQFNQTENLTNTWIKNSIPNEMSHVSTSSSDGKYN